MRKYKSNQKIKALLIRTTILAGIFLAGLCLMNSTTETSSLSLLERTDNYSDYSRTYPEHDKNSKSQSEIVYKNNLNLEKYAQISSLAEICPEYTETCVPCTPGELYCRYETGAEIGYLGWACQNNNPSNIRYSDYRINLITQFGGPAPCGERESANFMIFNSPNDGHAAFKAYILAINAGQHSSYPECGNCSIRYFFERYAPAGDYNDPDNYATRISEWLTIDPDTTTLSWVVENKLQEFMDGIKRMEGWFSTSPKINSNISMLQFDPGTGAKVHQTVQRVDMKVYTINRDEDSKGRWKSGGNIIGTPSLVVIENRYIKRLYQAIRSTDNTVLTRYTEDGENWTEWSESGDTVSDISMAVFNDRLFQAARAKNNEIRIRSTLNGHDWTSWKKIGTGSDNITMTAISSHPRKRLYLSTRGTKNDLLIKYTEDGSSWSSWEIGIKIKGNPALLHFYPKHEEDNTGGFNSFGKVEFEGKLYQAVRDTKDNMLIRYTKDGSTWSSWKYMGKAYSDITLFALYQNKKSRLYASFQGRNDSIKTKIKEYNKAWTELYTEKKAIGSISYAALSPPIKNPGIFLSHVSTQKDTILFQAVRGQDDMVYTRYSLDGLDWSKWQKN